MENNYLNRLEILLNKQYEGTEKQTQIQTVSDYLENHIATASMISKATGIPRSSIYTYKRRIEKSGRLLKITKSCCQQTGYKAWYLSVIPGKDFSDLCKALAYKYYYGK